MSKYAIILAVLLFVGCDDPPPDTRPRAEVQSAIAVDSNTNAWVITLPSGERILYVRMHYMGYNAVCYTISTTLLPPLSVERKP